MYEVQSFTPRRRTTPDSPILRRRDPSPTLRKNSPIKKVTTDELDTLKRENDALEAQLEKLKMEYQNIESSKGASCSVTQLIEKRKELEATLASLNSEIQAIDKNTMEVKERIHSSPARLRDLRQRSDFETALEILKKEENALKIKKSVKLDQRKEEMKTATKRDFAMMTTQKKLIESDIESFRSTIKQLRSAIGTDCTSPRVNKSCMATPTKPWQLRDRISAVNHEVASLECKCRVLQEFVALRSPDRFKKIISAKEYADEYPVLRI